MSSRKLPEGARLQPILQQAGQDVVAAATRDHGAHPRRYALHLPNTARKEWGASDTAAMKAVFGYDDLGEATTSMFQSATTKGFWV